MASGGEEKIEPTDTEFLDASDVVSNCYPNCTRTDSDRLIACDSGFCGIEWFHIECVGLSLEAIPKKKWLCPHCAMTKEAVLAAAQRNEKIASEEEDTIVQAEVGIGAKPKVKTEGVKKAKGPAREKHPAKDAPSMSRFIPGQVLGTDNLSFAPFMKLELKSQDDELHEISKKQKALEIEIARAKLESSQAELMALKAQAQSTEHSGKKSTTSPEAKYSSAASDLHTLLDKLCSKDDDDDDDLPNTEGKRSKKKSGLYKKASDEVKVHQKWPHLSLCLEYSSRNISFNDLTLAQFVAGETEIISGCSDDKERQGRIAFLKALMYDAVSCKFASILNFYAAWVREIELGKKLWGEDFSKIGDNILKRASFPDQNNKSSASSTATFKKGTGRKIVWYCSLFNRGKCSKESPHKQMINGRMREVMHICAACYNDSKAENQHAEHSKSCPLHDSDSDK